MRTLLTKQRFVKSIALLCCMAVAISCKKTGIEAIPDAAVINPITDFEIIKDPNDAFKFSFKNLSSKHKKLEWRFGDDSLTTETNPTHLYPTTGKYLMNLTSYSETGHKSRKQVDISILTDSVVKITTQKTSVANQVKFGLIVKAPVASVLWTFKDVTPAVTSTALDPVRTYAPGTFNTFTLKITTTGGSVINITSNNATTEGVLQDIVQLREGYEVSAENYYGANENSAKLLDNNLETKWTMGGRDGRLFTFPLLATLNFESKQTIKLYAIGNSNDNPNRDPKTWSLQGSNDGVTWEILDTRAMTKNFYDQMTALGATTDAQRYKQLFYYAIASPKAFFKYRLAIASNFGDAAMQLNELRLYR